MFLQVIKLFVLCRGIHRSNSYGIGWYMNHCFYSSFNIGVFYALVIPILSIYLFLLCSLQPFCCTCVGEVISQAYPQNPITRTDVPVWNYLALRETKRAVSSLLTHPRQISRPLFSAFDTSSVPEQRGLRSCRSHVPVPQATATIILSSHSVYFARKLLHLWWSSSRASVPTARHYSHRCTSTKVTRAARE